MKTKMHPRKAIVRFLPFVFSLLLLAACGGGDTTTMSETDSGLHDEHGAEVTLSAAQVDAIGLKTGTMEERGLKTALKANGRLVLPPEKNAQVSVLNGGIVKNIPVQEGHHVEKGQVLATLENLEFLQLQQDYLETAANVSMLRSDLERQQALQTDRINAMKTVERAQADLSGAQAKLAALAAQLRIYGSDPSRLSAESLQSTFTLRSPIAGNLKRIAVNLGQYAEPNRSLFEVVDNTALHIDLHVFEQDVARVKVGQHVVFGHAGEPVGVHTATIFAINKAFESDQQAVLAHAKLDDNGEELFSGMYIEALIMTDSTSAWSLPSDAVVSNGDEHYIFVEEATDSGLASGTRTFMQVAVHTGASELGYTEIIPLGPLPQDAKIVIKGAYFLLSELTKGSGEHNH